MQFAIEVREGAGREGKSDLNPEGLQTESFVLRATPALGPQLTDISISDTDMQHLEDTIVYPKVSGLSH